MTQTRLVLHLGMPKTGTSLLQNALVDLLRTIPETPLIYPGYGRGQRIAHHTLAQDIMKADPADITAIAEGLAADIADARAAHSAAPSVAACSSEAFTNLCGHTSAPRLAAFFDAFPDSIAVEGFIVLRELSDFLESMFLQSTRFGHQRPGFAAYVASRQKWAVALFQGLAFLQERLGDRMSIDAPGRGFDVIPHFAQKVGLPAGPLQRCADRVPSTARPSLKEQVAMTHLDQVEAALGFAIRRQNLVKLYGSGFRFDEDCAQFTLYDDAALAALEDLMGTVSKTPGYALYAAALGTPRARTKPVHSLEFSHLSDADLAALGQHSDALAA
jgi:hypothetical protein